MVGYENPAQYGPVREAVAARLSTEFQPKSPLISLHLKNNKPPLANIMPYTFVTQELPQGKKTIELAYITQQNMFSNNSQNVKLDLHFVDASQLEGINVVNDDKLPNTPLLQFYYFSPKKGREPIPRTVQVCDPDDSKKRNIAYGEKIPGHPDEPITYYIAGDDIQYDPGQRERHFPFGRIYGLIHQTPEKLETFFHPFQEGAVTSPPGKF